MHIRVRVFHIPLWLFVKKNITGICTFCVPPLPCLLRARYCTLTAGTVLFCIVFFCAVLGCRLAATDHEMGTVPHCHTAVFFFFFYHLVSIRPRSYFLHQCVQGSAGVWVNLMLSSVDVCKTPLRTQTSAVRDGSKIIMLRVVSNWWNTLGFRE